MTTQEKDKGEYRFSLELPKHYVATNGVVVNEEGHILLQKRADKETWEMPGGVLELNEELETGVLREIFEETGIQAEISGFIGVYKNMQRGILNFCFLCKPVGGELKTSEESLEVGYYAPEKAREMIVNPRQLQRFDDALELLSSGQLTMLKVTYK